MHPHALSYKMSMVHTSQHTQAFVPCPPQITYGGVQRGVAIYPLSPSAWDQARHSTQVGLETPPPLQILPMTVWALLCVPFLFPQLSKDFLGSSAQVFFRLLLQEVIPRSLI